MTMYSAVASISAVSSFSREKSSKMSQQHSWWTHPQRPGRQGHGFLHCCQHQIHHLSGTTMATKQPPNRPPNRSGQASASLAVPSKNSCGALCCFPKAGELKAVQTWNAENRCQPQGCRTMVPMPRVRLSVAVSPCSRIATACHIVQPSQWVKKFYFWTHERKKAQIGD
jgi:hypothetical protein